ncbi:MAG TPA: TnsA endonuclease N-terminal domain-containing protein [Magnetospirillaceae bacterium]|jgi:hypothetical protein
MVREIPLGRRSLTGRLPSRFGDDLGYESRIERNALVLLQFDQWLIDIRTQPFAITGEGIARRYTPDILATWQSAAHSPYGRARAVIEVKDAKTLREQAARLEPRFNAIRRHCEEQDMPFVILSEKQIVTPMLPVAERLLRYWNKVPPQSAWLSVASAVNDQGASATIGSVTLALMENGVSVDVVKPAIYHFLARRLLITDLNRDIDNQTPLSVPTAAQLYAHANGQL